LRDDSPSARCWAIVIIDFPGEVGFGNRRRAPREMPAQVFSPRCFTNFIARRNFSLTLSRIKDLVEDSASNGILLSLLYSDFPK